MVWYGADDTCYACGKIDCGPNCPRVIENNARDPHYGRNGHPRGERRERRVVAKKKLSNEDVLRLPMGENDAGAKTVREYLVALLMQLWTEKEGFSGKRPFGNGGWDIDLMAPLIRAGLIDGSFDEDGFVHDCDSDAGGSIIAEAINAL